MMRLDDSREAGLLNSSTQYSSLEMQMSEFDLPVSRRPRSRSRCYVVSVVFALVAVAAIVSVSVAGGKGNVQDDDSDKSDHVRSGPVGNLAPAPSPGEFFAPEAGFASAPPAPAVATTEPVSSPPAASEPVASPPASSPPLPPLQSAPQSVGTPPVAALAPSPYSSGFDEIRYQTVCNKTIDPAVCLNLFASNPNSSKADFQQWTILTMEVAEKALNESLTLALHLKESDNENVALEQCIDVFSEALALVNDSMYALANLDVENPGTTGADIREALNAAMTNHETCQEGIDDIGAFPGSDQITGEQARRVNTYLSIALTFFNELIAASEDPIPDDPHNRRRLLEIESTARRLIVGHRALLSTRSSQRAGRLPPGTAFA